MWLAGYLAALPLLALALGLLHRRGAGNESPWKYLYSTLVYLTSLFQCPGRLSSHLPL